MRVQICDTDTGGATGIKTIQDGMTVGGYFSNYKPSCNIADYSVLVNSVESGPGKTIPDGAQVSISRKKMVGALLDIAGSIGSRYTRL